MINGFVGKRGLRLAVIGLGERATHMAKTVCEADADVRITAIVDPRGPLATEAAEQVGLPGAQDIRVYRDIDTLADDADQFDGLMIGTPCNLHSPSAVQIARIELPLFLEKPVAVSWPQLKSLSEAYRGRENSVVVSFPLRLTEHVKMVTDILRTGRLGTINQIQAVNNVPYGGVYFGQWYRDYGKAGGLWLQKATHDFDYINHLMSAASPGALPVSITAMHSQTVYGGPMPADLHCSSCDRTEVCPESPINLTLRGSDGGMLNYATPTLNSDHACAFSKSIRNQDAGSALVMYSDGAHVSYSQNFITRGTAGRRGATVTGYNATLQFDWHSDVITVIEHFSDKVDRIKVESNGSHGGGDIVLARNFVDVMRGRDVSHAPLDQGLLSAAMCLAARDAAERGTTQLLGAVDGLSVPSNQMPVRGSIEPTVFEKNGFDSDLGGSKIPITQTKAVKPRNAFKI